MTTFYDKVSDMGRHAVSAACIIDSNGEVRGRVLIRFTPAPIGWNHEAGVMFGPAGLDLGTPSRGEVHSMPGTLFFLLREAGVKCYRHDMTRIGDYDDDPDDCKYDSLSRFNDIAWVKHGRRRYRLAWIL